MNEPSRIFILSQRSHANHASRGVFYEFEDVISTIDTVNLYSPNLALTYKVIRKAAKYTRFCQLFYSSLHQVTLTQKYDLFFACIQSPTDILSLWSVKNWRENCRVAVCWLDEIWLDQINIYKHHLQVLRAFDYIFLNFSSSIEPVANIVQRPCYEIPFGVDAIKFHPHLSYTQRSVAICNIGRRSIITHQALFALADKEKLFYIYDTCRSLDVNSYQEHRRLYSELLKQSRYFITNRAKFDEVFNQEELGPRFFEGIAAGTILLGTPPNCRSFTENFDWMDAVIPVPIDAPNIADVLRELDSNPKRLKIAHKNNITNALLRHDWVYRWKFILQVVDLPPTPQMASREALLRSLAKKAFEKSD